MTELAFFYYTKDWNYENIILPQDLDLWLNVKFNATYIIFTKCTNFNKLIFQNLYNVEKIVFLHPIEKIQSYTFSYNFVKKYIFTEKVKNIENNAFFKNYYLEEIYIHGDSKSATKDKIIKINKNLEYLTLLKLFKDKFKNKKVYKKIKLNQYFRNSCNRLFAELLAQ